MASPRKPRTKTPPAREAAAPAPPPAAAAAAAPVEQPAPAGDSNPAVLAEVARREAAGDPTPAVIEPGEPPAELPDPPEEDEDDDELAEAIDNDPPVPEHEDGKGLVFNPGDEIQGQHAGRFYPLARGYTPVPEHVAEELARGLHARGVRRVFGVGHENEANTEAIVKDAHRSHARFLARN
jgi:hypothetical protein